jgi:hypothetical protein
MDKFIKKYYKRKSDQLPKKNRTVWYCNISGEPVSAVNDSAITVYDCEHVVYKKALLAEIYHITHSVVKCYHDNLVKKYRKQCPVCEISRNMYHVVSLLDQQAEIRNAVIPYRYLQALGEVFAPGTACETEQGVYICSKNGEFHQVPTHDELPMWQLQHASIAGYRNLFAAVSEYYSVEFSPGVIYVGDYNQFVSNTTFTYDAEVRTLKRTIPDTYLLDQRKYISPDFSVERGNACLAKSLIKPGYYTVLNPDPGHFKETTEILLFDSGELVLLDSRGQNPIRL